MRPHRHAGGSSSFGQSPPEWSNWKALSERTSEEQIGDDDEHDSTVLVPVAPPVVLLIGGRSPVRPCSTLSLPSTLPTYSQRLCICPSAPLCGCQHSCCRPSIMVSLLAARPGTLLCHAPFFVAHLDSSCPHLPQHTDPSRCVKLLPADLDIAQASADS